jgi:hypothetical protein
MSNEVERMVGSEIAEVERYAKGLPFEHSHPQSLNRSA